MSLPYAQQYDLAQVLAGFQELLRHQQSQEHLLPSCAGVHLCTSIPKAAYSFAGPTTACSRLATTFFVGPSLLYYHKVS